MTVRPSVEQLLKGRVGVFSTGIYRQPTFRDLIGAGELVFRPAARQAASLGAVVGWGNRPTTKKARAFAQRHKLPFVALEDGWIRALGNRGHWARPLSMVRDDLGIYYDCRQPSRLEQLIAECSLSAEECAEASRLRQRIRDLGVSKYNQYRETPELPAGEKVLLVDQTYGDMSIPGAMASAETFQSMLAHALEKHPAADIYLKTHPDVVQGRKRGHFSFDRLPERVRVLSEGMNPIGLLKQIDHVHVVSSQLGAEAIMMGIPVTCHGVPYYAGWGLTEDLLPCERRRQRKNIDELFHASYLQYSSYWSPLTGEECTLSELLDFIETQFAAFDRNTGDQYCVGFRYWKRYIARGFLETPSNKVRFYRSVRALKKSKFRPGDAVVVWANRETAQLREFSQSRQLRLRRMEDGFLRSVGLGSDFFAPVSLVLDEAGIYYDPSRPSQLENLLNEREFTQVEQERASELTRRIASSGISKYNIRNDSDITGGLPGQSRILVPGQVEDDASVLRGGAGIQSNLELLMQIRASNPEACIAYKPHPDVVAGNRKSKSSEDDLRKLADIYVEDVNIGLCLEWCDEVHTLTSLTGFEALLKGKKVSTYGAPFYAGWGLTQDLQALPSRRRQRTLEELVAAVLIIYPAYFHWQARSYLRAEEAVEKLIIDREARPVTQNGSLPILKRGIIKGRQLLNIFRYS